MSRIFLLRFLIVVAAMLVSGVFGYLLARHRFHQDSDTIISTMSAEIIKMRRRATTQTG
ncbi:hypothetical protein GV827_12255 [Sulfitobacter sp. JBTF-M27]|uniref:Uncharacterized protein n=1 Tax=Sulfitobacter sediminilitoris TaxID=2698830 RepID=A0A6P0CFC1_9RHOB|nr:hypothetical protein [Sulfitobacter sediminilitoris]NEK23173.1 hypothetical protein [Sulfitobacter sediminilitoris]